MTLVAVLVLLLILVLAVPVAAGLGWLGLVLNQLYSPISLIVTTGEVTWSTTTSFILVAVPFYVLMGEIMLRTGMAERMYAAIAQWVSWLPGGLMHSNVVACAVWGAPSGSSVATAVTVGTVAIGEIKKHNYNEPLFLGTIAAGGTLGILIPPSTAFVIYGLLTEQSIGKLLLAGILPGLLLAAIFMTTVAIWMRFKPQYGPPGPRATWSERGWSLVGAGPMLFIVLVSIGGIYVGAFTPSEAAAVGAALAFAYALWRRSLGNGNLSKILIETVNTTALVFLILIGALVFGPFLALSGLPEHIAQSLAGLNVPRVVILIMILAVYILLGTFLEGFSMLVLTLPIVFPIITALGYDPIWFGVVMVIVLEMGLIDPPVGINVFIVKGLVPDVPMSEIFAGIVPFWFAMMVCIAILIMFPEIATFIPNRMIK
jgi:tripartite ATP-independent transporter DctM subunit